MLVIPSFIREQAAKNLLLANSPKFLFKRNIEELIKWRPISELHPQDVIQALRSVMDANNFTYQDLGLVYLLIVAIFRNGGDLPKEFSDRLTAICPWVPHLRAYALGEYREADSGYSLEVSNQLPELLMTARSQEISFNFGSNDD